jgi:DNA methylase
MSDYEAFLASKAFTAVPTGIAEPPPLNPRLFPFQSDITRWALKRGRAAMFLDCGMGKTICQLDWARVVADQTVLGRVLILAPLAVAKQTVREAEKFGVACRYLREDDGKPGVVVTNYEMLDHFDAASFSGVVLDESSILKSYDGKTRTRIIEAFRDCRFRLACTATPAPNDHMELGNHAEFLGIMSRVEMLASFFCHDGGETQTWRLKGHAVDAFWRWVCSWAVTLRKPSDLGHDDGAFILPPLEMHAHVIPADHKTAAAMGKLFVEEAASLTERRDARRASLDDRVRVAADLATASGEPWIIWTGLNAEGDAVTDAIPGAIQIAGSDTLDAKESRLADWISGKTRVLVSKAAILGFGINAQHCRNVAFVGLSDSYESFYQSIRRCWRFGQTQPVHCHVITGEAEGAVVRNIERKELEAKKMGDAMVEHMRTTQIESVRGAVNEKVEYATGKKSGERWEMHLGDCVDVVRGMTAETVDYTIFSPPFASLYTYSNSDRDMGNVRDHAEFFDHFAFLVGELYRVTKPGRLLSFHCMNLPTSKARDGVIGITDFRGTLIRAFEAKEWIYHSEVVIWKDPVTAMQRTKALGLLYKQLRKDSAMSRQGIPDYLVTMRKPGVNPSPVTKTHDSFPVDRWQRYASPVWMDIDASDTLQHRSVREEADERHICPLQLGVIRRGIELWTNPGDTVLSPFAGIGSEGYISVQEGRRFVGVELKPAYFEQACANLREAAGGGVQPGLFARIEAPAP